MKPLKRRWTHAIAGLYRTLFGLYSNTCFIGITGSCGKTTTTELVSSILALEGSVHTCIHVNTSLYIARSMLSLSRRHRFCVSEVSADTVGQIARTVRLLKPHIGVVTRIGQDHYSQYRTLEATADEKGKLVESLSANGTAVLNADDPHVLAMRSRTTARVITYGLSPEAMVRGENVSSNWPDTLSLEVTVEQQRFSIRTKLLGEHWASTVLAAMATAIAAGVSPARAIEAIEAFEPIPYRMCPHPLPGGITFISDNWKASLWLVPASLDFMKKANAARKIAVIGSISDTPKSFYGRYRTIVTQALEAVDTLLVVGEHAHTAKRVSGIDPNRVMAFATLDRLNDFLEDYLKAGDLVLLKGTENSDHLQRLIHTRNKPISCWKYDCRKKKFCSDCRHLYACSETSSDDPSESPV